MITATQRPTCTYHAISTTITSTDDGIDLIAVERAINDRRPLPHLTTAEKHAALDAMNAAGLSRTEMARRAGMSTDTVAAWLDRDKPRGARELKPCPSRAAYLRHRRRGETCEPCRAANAAADRQLHTGSTAAA